jgi:anti-sigma B factor antagonist
METAIGIFDSRNRAEEALKELLRRGVPQESIVFATRSENDATLVARELAAYEGFPRGADVITTVLTVPGLGKVLVVSVGEAALVGLGGAPNAPAMSKSTAKDVSHRGCIEANDVDAALFRKLMKAGHSLVLVRTPWHEIASAACGILSRFGIGTQERTGATLQISTRQIGEITLLDLKGRIHMGEGAVMLRETVTDLFAKGHKKILVNLNDVESVDSSGIGEFVRIHTTLRKQGGQLKLANVYEKLDEMLHMTCLHTVLDIQKDEATAMKSFGFAAGASA